MKVLVLLACLAAAVADVPHVIKEKKTIVEALPHAYETPDHFDEKNGPFHFAELRSLQPIVSEKVVDTQQQLGTTVDVKEYKIGQTATGNLGASLTAAPISQYEKVVKTVESSAAPAVSEYHVHQYQQQPASLVLHNLQQAPVASYQQTFVSQPQSTVVYKTTEKVEEKPSLTSGEIQKVEKIEKVEKVEGSQKVELPALTPYSGAYEHQAYIQKQPALASLSVYGVKSALPQQTITTYTKEVVSNPAVTTTVSQPSVTYQHTAFSQPITSSYEKKYVSSVATPVLATFSSGQPASSTYKQSVFSQSSYAASPAETTYSQPAVTTYKQVVSQTPAVASYKKESVFGQSNYAAAPAVTTFSQPAVTSYKQVVSQTPAVASYKKESVFGQSNYAAAPAVATYSTYSQPAVTSYKQVASLSASPDASLSTYQQQTSSALKTSSSLYGESSSQYGGAVMSPSSYQSSADGASSILKLYKDGDGTGIYQYGYATSNGINHDEEGKVVASTDKDGSSAVTGSYSYVGPDGVTYTVKYIADENGFRAFGDHLPKLSEEQQRAIEEGAKDADKYDEQGKLIKY